jgi:hypothetical protein
MAGGGVALARVAEANDQDAVDGLLALAALGSAAAKDRQGLVPAGVARIAVARIAILGGGLAVLAD